MSYFKCPHCSEKSYIFGHGGAQKTAEELDMKFLGEVWLLSSPMMIFMQCNVHFGGVHLETDCCFIITFKKLSDYFLQVIMGEQLRVSKCPTYVA